MSVGVYTCYRDSKVVDNNNGITGHTQVYAPTTSGTSTSSGGCGGTGIEVG